MRYGASWLYSVVQLQTGGMVKVCRVQPHQHKMIGSKGPGH